MTRDAQPGDPGTPPPRPHGPATPPRIPAAAASLLAVDLGRTSCRAMLQTGMGHTGMEQAGTGRSTGEGPGAPGLAEPNGVAAAAAAILATTAPLLRRAGLSGVTAAGIGVAGALAAPQAAQALAEHLRAALPAASVAVTSDAVASHAGAFGGGPGLMLAIGTGVVALSMTRAGVLRRADGLGPWLGDEGGGAAIGLAGLRAALRAAERRGPPTTLQAAATARFGALSDLPARLAALPNPPRLAAGFAPDVAAASRAGDPVAEAVLHAAAASLAATAASAAGDEEDASVALLGGLLGLGPALLAPLHAALAAGTPRLRPIAPLGTALDGALLLARRHDTAHEPHVARSAAPPVPPETPGNRLDRLATEALRPGLEDLDRRPPSELVQLALAIEREAQDALARAAPALGALAEAVAARMRAGGRLFTLGAGTPGRLATLDAAELGPTFDVAPGLVVPLLAGGPAAMLQAAEGAEDDAHAAAAALDAHGLAPGDAVVGIAASGRTPFVVGGLAHARACGALTGAIVNNPGSPAAAAAELAVEILTGPELVAGSTRMAAGTTQKIALNALSTAVMVSLGKTYGARMVDVRATNAKLRRRALRTVCEVTGSPEPEAAAALDATAWRVKPALVMLLAGLDAAAAEARLHAAGGRVRDALDPVASPPATRE